MSHNVYDSQTKELTPISSSSIGSIFVGATSSVEGIKGLVPAPNAGDEDKYLKGDGTWGTVSGGGGAALDNFVGTQEEWDALTLVEKAQYKTVDITNDYNGLPIDSVPTQNSQNVVQSGGVYSAIANASSGNFIGTRDEWDQLTTTEKAQYKTMDFKDDYYGRGIDSVPTQGSTNAVQSGGTYEAIDSVSTALTTKVNTSDIANNLTTTDSGKVLDARQGTAIKQALANEADTRATLGAHNLIPYPYEESSGTSRGGITFSYNNDGIITISGTKGTDNSHIFLLKRAQSVEFVKLMKNKGCKVVIEKTLPTTRFEIEWYDSSQTFIRTSQYYENENIGCPNNAVYCQLVVMNGSNRGIEVSDTVKVMILLTSDPYTEYTPYAPTNAECAVKTDLTNIHIAGTTNNTGSTIAKGTFFYLNGTLVKAMAAISDGATFTKDTNYEVVTAGALNDINELTNLTITPNKTPTRADVLRVRKIGRVVQVLINNVIYSDSASSDMLIFTVDSTVKPNLNTRFVLYDQDMKMVSGLMDTSGGVYINHYTGGKLLYGSFTYFI